MAFERGGRILLADAAAAAGSWGVPWDAWGFGDRAGDGCRHLPGRAQYLQPLERAWRDDGDCVEKSAAFTTRVVPLMRAATRAARHRLNGARAPASGSRTNCRHAR